MATKEILLVEDSFDDADLTQRALSKLSIETRLHRAYSGVEALELLFDEASVRPALLLVDLKMPMMDGLDFIKRVRADPRTRFLPIVVLTSSNEPRDIIQSYALGANSYIQKPVDYDVFARTIQRIVEYWLLENFEPPLR